MVNESLTEKDWKIIESALNSRIAYCQQQLAFLQNYRRQNETPMDIRKEQMVYWKTQAKRCTEVKMKLPYV